tara:strand:- start:227 stop:628 length:402 start_codon:yes stop_codon:yes gene_type:complete
MTFAPDLLPDRLEGRLGCFWFTATGIEEIWFTTLAITILCVLKFTSVHVARCLGMKITTVTVPIAFLTQAHPADGGGCFGAVAIEHPQPMKGVNAMGIPATKGIPEAERPVAIMVPVDAAVALGTAPPVLAMQ